MKNFLLIFIICFSLPVFATEFEPKWEDIAPAKYVDAEYQVNNTFYNKHPLISSFGGGFTIVGLPFLIKSMNKSEKINEGNYWVTRKKSFDNSLLLCKEMESKDNRLNCYNNLIQTEQTKTFQRNQIRLQSYAILQNSINATNIQNAINNNANRVNYYRY